MEKFEDKSSFLLAQCLENGLNKEMELPKLINEIVKKLSGSDTFVPQLDQPKRKMRSAEEIKKDYGL